MPFPFGDAVSVVRGGVAVGVVRCGWDPAERKLYGPFGSILRQGDFVSLRGFTARVADPVESWRNPLTGWEAGDVAQLEPPMPLLPDAGALFRGDTAAGHFDTDAEVWVSDTALVPIWEGPCAVVPVSQGDEAADVAEQQVSVQPFDVTVPLSVVDVRPDDTFIVTVSRDGRLVTPRELTVVRVEAGSDALVRTFRAIDNQG